MNDADSLISVVTGDAPAAANDAMVSAFDIRTRVPGQTAPIPPATLIAGGKIQSQAGSGTMAITVPSDAQVEAGEKISTLTLVYKSATVLMDVDLAVDVKGIVLTDDPDTADVTEELGGSTYGVVSYRGNFSPTPDIGEVGQDLSTPRNDMVTITWEGLNFTKAGQTFTIDIKNVRVRAKGGAVEFTTRISGAVVGQDAPVLVVLAASPKLYITDTQDGNVEFKITSASADVTDSTFASFHAGEEVDTIVFTFEAVRTAIKDGQVRFTLPSGWTAMKAPSVDAVVDTLGELSIGAGGGFLLKAAGGKPKTPLSVSSRTVTVGVPALGVGDPPVMITINSFTGTDEIANKVTVQGNATEADKPEKITGYFWTSGSRGRGYNAGTVEIEITNVADGYGNATISPSSVSAGSVNEEITIDFTAAGTMGRRCCKACNSRRVGKSTRRRRHRG